MKRRNQLFLTGALLLTISFIISCGPPRVQTKVDTSGPTIGEALSYQGPRARIAVARFDCKAAKCGDRIGYGMTDMLSSALFKSGRFVVLERGEGLYELKEELNLGRSGYTDPRKSPATGKMEGADILVIGAITAFEPKASGRRGGAVIIPFGVPLLGGIRVKENEAYLVADLRLVDVSSGRIVNATSVEGRASSYRVGGLGGFIAGNVLLGAGLDTYQNTPMEKAIRVMLDNSISAIAKMIPENYYRYDSLGRTYPPPGESFGGRDSGPGGGIPPTSSLIVGGGTYLPGRELAFSEDFQGLGPGDEPKSMDIDSGDVEIAQFSGSNWLRFLTDGSVSRKVDLARDFSIEFKVYKPRSFPSMKFQVKPVRLPSAAFGWKKDVTWKGSRVIPEGLTPGSIHSVAIENRRGTMKLFIDGKLVSRGPAAAGNLFSPAGKGGFTISAEGVNVGKGRELLIGDIRVAYY